ncbi:MAG: hypothetical protein PVF77_12715, partial [Anaerolineae bacterium]
MLKWLRGRNGSANGTHKAQAPALGPVNGLEELAGISSRDAGAMIDLQAITKVYETDAGPFLALKGI